MTNYFEYTIYLNPKQIAQFGESLTLPIDFNNIENKKSFIVFLTNSQIKKVIVARISKEKIDLKLSKTQFDKTFNKILQKNKLTNLKKSNKRKEKELDELKLEYLKKSNKSKKKQLDKLKVENYKKKL